MAGLIAVVALGALAAVLATVFLSLASRVKESQRRALAAERAAGIALQALLGAANNPMVDRDTAAYLSAYLNDVRRELDAVTRKELP